MGVRLKRILNTRKNGGKRRQKKSCKRVCKPLKTKLCRKSLHDRGSCLRNSTRKFNAKKRRKKTCKRVYKPLKTRRFWKSVNGRGSCLRNRTRKFNGKRCTKIGGKKPLFDYKKYLCCGYYPDDEEDSLRNIIDEYWENLKKIRADRVDYPYSAPAEITLYNSIYKIMVLKYCDLKEGVHGAVERQTTQSGGRQLDLKREAEEMVLEYYSQRHKTGCSLIESVVHSKLAHGAPVADPDDVEGFNIMHNVYSISTYVQLIKVHKENIIMFIKWVNLIHMFNNSRNIKVSPNSLIAKFEKYLEYKLESRFTRDRRAEAAARMEDMKRFLNKTVSTARVLRRESVRRKLGKETEEAINDMALYNNMLKAREEVFQKEIEFTRMLCRYVHIHLLLAENANDDIAINKYLKNIKLFPQDDDFADDPNYYVKEVAKKLFPHLLVKINKAIDDEGGELERQLYAAEARVAAARVERERELDAAEARGYGGLGGGGYNNPPTVDNAWYGEKRDVILDTYGLFANATRAKVPVDDTADGGYDRVVVEAQREFSLAADDIIEEHLAFTNLFKEFKNLSLLIIQKYDIDMGKKNEKEEQNIQKNLDLNFSVEFENQSREDQENEQFFKAILRENKELNFSVPKLFFPVKDESVGQSKLIQSAMRYTIGVPDPDDLYEDDSERVRRLLFPKINIPHHAEGTLLRFDAYLHRIKAKNLLLYNINDNEELVIKVGIQLKQMTDKFENSDANTSWFFDSVDENDWRLVLDGIKNACGAEKPMVVENYWDYSVELAKEEMENALQKISEAKQADEALLQQKWPSTKISRAPPLRWALDGVRDIKKVSDGVRDFFDGKQWVPAEKQRGAE